MRRFRLMAGLAALVIAAVLGAAHARASDDRPPACRYVWVTRHVAVGVPYTTLVTLYDDCGRPRQVDKTCRRTVQVSVRRRVAIRECPPCSGA